MLLNDNGHNKYYFSNLAQRGFYFEVDRITSMMLMYDVVDMSGFSVCENT